MELKLQTYIVDAFVLGSTEKPFSGNPAGVCFLEYDDDISDEAKQGIAAELNMPITAFVSRGWSKLQPKHASETRWSIRWFTSTIEYPLCGHASLATSKLIFTQLLKRTSDEETEATVEFETRTKGVLSATISWLTGLVTLNFPSNPPTQLLRNDNKWIDILISNTLGPNVSPALVEDIQYSLATSILVLVLKNDTKESNETFLRTLKPNFSELTAPDTGKLVLKPLMVVATVRGSPDGTHFYSRVFCPSIGYNEDHACGSAHTVLTPYWNPKLGLDKAATLHGIQVSPRGSEFFCSLESGDRVNLSGNARQTLKGEVTLQAGIN